MSGRHFTLIACSKLTCQVVYAFAVLQLVSINVHEIVSHDGIRFSMAMIAVVSPWSSARGWRGQNCWQSQQRSPECSFHDVQRLCYRIRHWEKKYLTPLFIPSVPLHLHPWHYAKPPQSTTRYIKPSYFAGGHPKAFHVHVPAESMDAVKVGRRGTGSGRNRKEETGTMLPRKRRFRLVGFASA